MSVAENKAMVRHNYEQLNERNLVALYESFAADCVWHAPGGREIRSLEMIKQIITGLLNAFPNLHMTIDYMVAEGDKVVARVRWTGTHKGEYLGTAPTGKQVTFTAITMYRIVGGKVVEIWEEGDSLGLRQQLGIIPSQ
ncbi:MAG: ester cyclase [Candidatus Thorarchaeota archaeon]